MDFSKYIVHPDLNPFNKHLPDATKENPDIILNIGSILKTKYSPVVNIIMAFCFGSIFAPWSYGVFPLVVFIIFYEFVFYFLTYGQYENYEITMRAIIILSTILGWIVSRTIFFPENILDPALIDPSPTNISKINISMKGNPPKYKLNKCNKIIDDRK